MRYRIRKTGSRKLPRSFTKCVPSIWQGVREPCERECWELRGICPLSASLASVCVDTLFLRSIDVTEFGIRELAQRVGISLTPASLRARV